MNPGFEDAGSANSIPGWTLWRAPWGSGETAVTTTSAKISGSRGLMLTCASSSFGVYQEVAVTPGRAYRLNGWWKGTYPPGVQSWYDCELLRGPFNYTMADIRPDDLPTKVCTYDPAESPWDWELMSDAYHTAPFVKDGTRIATSNRMTVVLKTGGFSQPFGYYDDIVLEELPEMSIAEAKEQPDGCAAALGTCVVTGFLPGSPTGTLFIQSRDRSAGIRVATSAAINRGTQVRVSGTLGTLLSGERYLQPEYATANGGTAPPEPLNIRLAEVGGAATPGFNPATGAGQCGVQGGQGLNNIGLFVQAWGRVVERNTTLPELWFTMDDGSGAPVRVSMPPGGWIPELGTFVTVPGISSCFDSGGQILPQIQLLNASDIRIVWPVPE